MLTHKKLKQLLSYSRGTGLFHWRVDRSGNIKAGDVAGTLTGGGYVQISIDGKKLKAHRLAWFYVKGVWPEGEVDHKDTDRTNNRWRNLRDVPGRINTQNKRKAYSNNKSGMLGVSVCGKSFRARICVDGVERHLGSFPTARKAREAYVAAKRTLHVGCTL
ncbi:HNH endonuclease signature motif containing protein [Variovorax sp. 278MFTsu5.1]|uniref:HNH endonuclease signature motif containing protein n=1 Tax=Variovorax sp. 278MFTsu5.1 TaxID=3158366 RepID=UPI003AAB40DC